VFEVAFSAPAFRLPRLENPETWKKDDTALENRPKVPSEVVVFDVDTGATLDVLDRDPMPESGLDLAGAFASSWNLSSRFSTPRSCHSIPGGGCIELLEFIAASTKRDVVRRGPGGRTGVVEVEEKAGWAMLYNE
jgi:hypothetical protein